MIVFKMTDGSKIEVDGTGVQMTEKYYIVLGGKKNKEILKKIKSETVLNFSWRNE